MNNSTVTLTPEQQETCRKFNYNFYNGLVERYRRDAEGFDRTKQRACAELSRMRQAHFVALRDQYASVEVVAAQSFAPVTGIAAAFDAEKVEVIRG